MSGSSLEKLSRGSLGHEIDVRYRDAYTMTARIPLYNFPDVVLHAPESAVKGHTEYSAAKGGDLRAADVLTSQMVNSIAVEQIGAALEERIVELVPIHALESAGVNEIPAALATVLSRFLGLPVNNSIVQDNSVGHTGADGFTRLAHQALFSGTVVQGQWYLSWTTSSAKGVLWRTS